jgi:CheY-like chemotaxis protein
MTPDSIEFHRTGAPAVMVVEDSDGVRRIIRMQLKTLGYQVIDARNGFDAVELGQKKRPDLILMDIYMPEVDGLEVTSLIRRTDEMSRIPIIGMSAHYGAEIRTRILAAGCNEFVTKPLDFKHLGSLISRYLRPD